MKLLVVILLNAVVSVSASSDLFWMNLISEQINEASLVGTEDAEDIPTLASDLGLKTLVELVGKAGLTDALKGDGPFTLFGPSDEAFGRLPKALVEFLLKNTTLLAELLKYHVLPVKAESGSLSNDELVGSLERQAVRVNIYTKEQRNKTETVITASGRRVLKADQEASNGVIHVVDGVLFPPAGSITDVVAKTRAFSFLLKGLKTANLVNALAGDGPFTVFAPTDDAFMKIGKKCLIALFKDIEKLKKVLTYHVVPGTDYSAGLTCGEKLKTLEGSEVQVRFKGRRMSVNRAAVVCQDITVTNGVIQVIDGVLFPEDDDVNVFCDDVIHRREKIDVRNESFDILDWLDD